MQRNSTSYTIIFAVVLCVICSLLVATSAVVLAPRQEANAVAYQQKNVLLAAGLVQSGQGVSNQEIQAIFDEKIEVRIVDLATGEYAAAEAGLDPKSYSQRAARDDPALSSAAPENESQIKRVPKFGLVYLVKDYHEGYIQVVIPIEGIGLWGTLYGFLALLNDTITINGITYYEHKETPGLGGEVDNPLWKSLWPGRKAYDENWEPAITVIKGSAGGVEDAPYSIDGLSGATITSNGVTNMLHFWLGEHGYGPYLEKFRATGGV